MKQYTKPVVEKIEFAYQNVVAASGESEPCRSVTPYGNIDTDENYHHCTSDPVGAPTFTN